MVETDANTNEGCCVCCRCFKWGKKTTTTEDEVIDDNVHESLEQIPYESVLHQKLQAGVLIAISGFIPFNCHRFSINLKCGVKDQNADIAFHFNPRLEQRYVVRNCRINGHWGTEDTSAVVKFPFEYNKEFDVHILVTDQEFMVTVNGVHWCAFAFRLPLNQVTAMDVKGKAEVRGVRFRTLTSYPEITTSYPIIQHSQNINTESTENLTIPYTGVFSKSFTVGWELNVKGRVKLLPHTFYINLQDGSHLWPHPIIPLHLNPRFSTKYGEEVFVRNCWSDGKWGAEERATAFPFSPGGTFSMVIRKEVDHFSVWVDGQLTGEFPFKTSAEKVTCIYIQGDVIINHISLTEKRKGMLHPKFADEFSPSV